MYLNKSAFPFVNRNDGLIFGYEKKNIYTPGSL